MVRRLSWLASIALLVGLTGPALAQDSGTKERAATDYEWVFHYYMAYDNNLEACGEPIVKMLEEGITSDNTVAKNSKLARSSSVIPYLIASVIINVIDITSSICSDA